jgi:hypothetical protein
MLSRLSKALAAVSVTIIAAILLFAIVSLSTGVLSGEKEGSDLIQGAAAMEMDSSSISVATPTIVVSTTKATMVATTTPTPVPTTKATPVVTSTTIAPTQAPSSVVTPRKLTTKDIDLYISDEDVRPFTKDWLTGYEHSVEISNRGNEVAKGIMVEIYFEDAGIPYEAAVPVEIPAHGSAKVDFPPFGGGCNQNPNKVGIILKGYG